MSGTSRNSIRYNSVGLFLTDAPAVEPYSDKIRFFNRVQSFGLSMDVQRENIRQIGSENFLERKIVQNPDININIDYLLTDGYEESLLGLNVAPAPIEISQEFGVIDREVQQNGTIYNDLKEDRSMFMVVGDEAFDLTGYAKRPQGYSGSDAIGIGNCFLRNYSIKASVGGFATASVDMVASNINYACMGSGEGGFSWVQTIEDFAGLLREIDGFEEDFVTFENGQNIGLEESFEEINFGGAENPSLDLVKNGKRLEGTGFVFDPTMYHSAVSAIHQGGIDIEIRNLDMGGPLLSGKHEGTCFKGSANIQSFDISVPFDRENLMGFESANVYGRKLKMPQIGTVKFSLLSSVFTSGSFQDLLCNDDDYEIEITLSSQCRRTCGPDNIRQKFMKFSINNARLDGYSFSEQLGSFATVDCSFSFGMSRDNGLFVSGCYENPVTTKCGPSAMAAPRNLGIKNVSEIDSPTNLNIYAYE